MDQYIIAIETSASKTTLLLAKHKENGNYSIEPIHSESRPTSFVVRGQIDKTAEARKAISNLLANRNVTKALQNNAQAHFCLSVAGLSVQSVMQTVELNMHGMTVNERTIDEARRSACDQASLENPDWTVANVSLQKYHIDNLRISVNPLGEVCDVLGATYIVMMVRKSSLPLITESLGTAAHPYLYSVASSKSVVLLSPEQKENGVALIDFGASVTNVAVYYKGYLCTEASIPLGSDLLTRDIMHGLELSHDHAEILKKAFGIAPEEDKDSQSITPEFPDGGTTKQPIIINDIKFFARARMEELLSYVDSAMQKNGAIDRVKKIVITGRGAKLKGLASLVESTWKVPVEVADETQENYDLACVVGMASRFARDHRKLFAQPTQGTLFGDGEIETMEQPETTTEEKTPAEKPKKTTKRKKGFFSKMNDMFNDIVEGEDA